MKNLNTLPLIPTREILFFPSSVIPIVVGRKFSVLAIEEAIERNEGKLILGLQKNSNLETFNGIDEIENVAVVGKILQVITLQDSSLKVLIEGINRVKIDGLEKKGDVFFAKYSDYPITKTRINAEKNKKYVNYLKKSMEDLKIVNSGLLPKDLVESIFTIKPLEKLMYTIATTLEISGKDKYDILSSNSIDEIFENLVKLMKTILEFEKIDKDVEKKVKKNIEQNQKQYYIREKIKGLYSELEEDSQEDEVEILKEKLEESSLPIELKEKLSKELKRLKKMNEFSSEASVVRAYVETLLELPWEKVENKDIDILKAEKILNDEHFGLNKVKNTILEYMAVNQLNKNNENKMPTILCLVGPPGVGKTSFATSIAHAMDRKFERISLGGVSDESEIRGHRRTYVGAMPGRIIEAMKRVKVTNPVILLDEIDKLSKQFKGDPASALLEVLDPAQNKTFKDNYVDFEYDLSNAFFICTANYYGNIPKPLLDRMEVIFLDSYTVLEKLEIAKKHLIKQIKLETNIKDIKLSDNVIVEIIDKYTSEAGVRNLKREILKIFRKVAKIKLTKPDEKIKISTKNLEEFLGVEKLKKDKNATKVSKIGKVKGLAWTVVGGTTLDVEAVSMVGKGNVIFTGQLGDVMKESARVAYSFVRANDKELNILDTNFHLEKDLHIHFPEGATPKDGPSAGITITTAIVSILANKKVKQNIAMTGEITIRGEVLPVGGIKEKVLAAHRIGIREIILPYDNMVDTKEIPEEVISQLKIHFVKSYKEVFEIVFD